MRDVVGRWRVLLAGAGMAFCGALMVLGADQPETIVLPDPPSASAPAVRRVVTSAPMASAPSTIPASAPALVKKPRLAVPTGAALAAAVKLVDEVYREDVVLAKTPGQRENLARRMKADAAGEKDAAGRYAMLVKARDLAVEAGDVGTVGEVIGELERGYEVDGLKLASEMLAGVVRSVHTPGQKKGLADFTQVFAERALEAESYDVARAMAEKNAMAARMAGDLAMSREAVGLLQAVTDAEAAYAAAKKGLDVLATKPEDGDANLKVGMYRCFYRGDWKEGLVKLAAGSDRGLAELAKKELAGGDALMLGDGWWDVGVKGTLVTKKQIWKHAAGFYTTAMPGLSGLLKARVAKRLEEAGLGESGLEVPGFVTAYLDSVSKQLPVKGDTPRDFSMKLGALAMRAQTCLKVDGTDQPIRFPAKLMRVTLMGKMQSMSYEQQFEYNGVPVRLTALRTKQSPDGKMDAEFLEASAQLKDHPDAVYWIEGSAQGLYVSSTGAVGEAGTLVLLRVRWAQGKTFAATMRE